MLKLLFIPSGHIFTLPDEEAFRIKKEDRANEYRILDAGFTEEKEESVSSEEVEELVLKNQQRAEEIEQEDEAEKAKIEEARKAPKKILVEDGADPYKNITKPEIVGILKKYGLPGNISESKTVLIERCIKNGIEII